jgi:hypothetical protein
MAGVRFKQLSKPPNYKGGGEVALPWITVDESEGADECFITGTVSKWTDDLIEYRYETGMGTKPGFSGSPVIAMSKETGNTGGKASLVVALHCARRGMGDGVGVGIILKRDHLNW